MAAIQFIVKYFPEITIKGRATRGRLSRQLASNVRQVLSEIDPQIRVRRHWDKLEVTSELPREDVYGRLVDGLSRCSGVASFLDVLEYPLGDLTQVSQVVLALYRERLAGNTFAVRCKRTGRHPFRSTDVEREVGTALDRHTEAAGVDLRAPQVTVRLEIRDQRLFVVERCYQGLGGFPTGSLGPVLSLVSGGFDSSVASYLSMKRGLLTHFCFFNLGGRDHELRVKETALYLWLKYGSTHSVNFISVPFEEVVAQLLSRVADPQMGVVLKRMMLRTATQLAQQGRYEALVTGESVAQVSSQTLRNLAVIDSVTDHLLLRPLISTDKNEIIRLAAKIGVEQFAAQTPEYCGVISVNPATRSSVARAEAAERQFDFAVLERALQQARVVPMRELADADLDPARGTVEVLATPLVDSVVIDVRHPTQAELQPLRVPVPVQQIPFYELHGRAATLNADQTYLLYCDRGVISRLHAGHLLESGFDNFKVYRPAATQAPARTREVS